MEGETSQGGFHTTRWSILQVHSKFSDTEKDLALEHLCQHYWQPLYVYLRKSGYSQENSEDLIQGFFAEVIKNPTLIRRADKKIGKFRSFLLGALKFYISDTRKSGNALKRGGGIQHMSFDFQDSESHFQTLSGDDASEPHSEFDKSWAFSIFKEAVIKVRARYNQGIDLDIFQWITGDSKYNSLQSIADKNNATNEAVRMRVSRARKDLREMIDLEIRETVTSDMEFKNEREYLLHIIQNFG